MSDDTGRPDAAPHQGADFSPYLQVAGSTTELPKSNVQRKELSETSWHLMQLEEASLGSFPSFAYGEGASPHPKCESTTDTGDRKNNELATSKGEYNGEEKDDDDDDDDDEFSESFDQEDDSTVDQADKREQEVRRTLLFAILSACGMIFCMGLVGKVLARFRSISHEADEPAAFTRDAVVGNASNAATGNPSAL